MDDLRDPNSRPPGDPNSPIDPEDKLLLDSLRAGGEWLRALLCTLARRGLAFRREHPERARRLLDSLAAYPYYKGGQFLFDLMEWEDFMLDGPLPASLPLALDAASLDRIASTLREIQRHFDGAAIPNQEPAPAGVRAVIPENDELHGGLYFYEDVVLGVLQSVKPFLTATSSRPTT
jgi:hypothetical protein